MIIESTTGWSRGDLLTDLHRVTSQAPIPSVLQNQTSPRCRCCKPLPGLRSAPVTLCQSLPASQPRFPLWSAQPRGCARRPPKPLQAGRQGWNRLTSPPRAAA